MASKAPLTAKYDVKKMNALMKVRACTRRTARTNTKRILPFPPCRGSSLADYTADWRGWWRHRRPNAKVVCAAGQARPTFFRPSLLLRTPCTRLPSLCFVKTPCTFPLIPLSSVLCVPIHAPPGSTTAVQLTPFLPSPDRGVVHGKAGGVPWGRGRGRPA